MKQSNGTLPDTPGGLPTTLSSQELIKLESDHGAHNYHPLPVVFAKAKGIYVWDPEGKKYMDFLSAYSAVNQGHCHPKIIQTLIEQAQTCTLASRAFYNDVFGKYAQYMTKCFHYEMVLPMNTGAEAVETALKLARKWGYLKKGIAENEAWVLGMTGNFHGRTLGVISMSTEGASRDGFGPYLPNVGAHMHECIVPFGDVDALETVLRKYHATIAAVLVEPVQGEAGVQVPPPGYLARVAQLAQQYRCLWIADEIQTGLGRTGKWLACDWDNVRPDILLLGKALAGGVVPVSAVLANRTVMECIQPGEHGSTFGGNPLGCAVAMTALKVLQEEHMVENAATLGEVFRAELQPLRTRFPWVLAIRGRGLLNAIELHKEASPISAWQICLLLIERGLLAKPTHDTIIRFAPPLCITHEELMQGIEIIKDVFASVETIDVNTIPRKDW